MQFQTRPGLLIRSAGPVDLPLVKEICADVWGGNDYVPYVWLEWAADPASRLFILEMEGRPAGLYCLRFGLAGPGTSWIQGVRVRTEFKRRGLAGEIVKHAIETSRAEGMTVLRYTTAEDNLPMHRLAAQAGFRHVGNFVMYSFAGIPPSKPAALPWRLVTTSEFDGAYNLITNSPEYEALEGFYCNGWRWKPLTIERLRKHLERREVFTLTGALKALAIITRWEDGGPNWLAYLTGESAAQQTLLSEMIRRVAGLTPPQSKIQFNAQLPQTKTIEEHLNQAGFKPDDHEPILCLYELNLSSS